MTEREVERLTESLTKVEGMLRSVSASAWDRLDAVEFEQLSRARGWIQGELDYIDICQGKTPPAVR